MGLLTYNGETFEDESVFERICGLTEMFPAPLRKATSKTATVTVDASNKLYKLARFSMWVGTTCFMVLCLPVVFEQERFQLEMAQKTQERRMLLGPNIGQAS